MDHTELEPGLNELTGRVLEAAIHVHRTLGPGLLERAYRICLAHELAVRGMDVAAEIPISVRYGTEVVQAGLRLDLLVGGRVVVEVKAVERLHAVHVAQVLTYLRMSGQRVGLLLNFNAFPLAIKRLVRQDSPALMPDEKQQP